MRRHIPLGARVLELGCGTGWLTLLLAEAGVSSLVGTDFSPAQIERARRNAARSKLADRVDFRVTGMARTDRDEGDTFDVVIMHAFLHHLSTDEVRAALEEAAARLRPGGQLLVVEPVHFIDGPTAEPVTLKVLRRLESLPRMLLHRGLRSAGPEELEVRRQLTLRATGVPPFGPAPKEIPFEPAEIDGLLSEDFEIEARFPVLSMAHLVSQEILLAGLSQPRVWRSLEAPLLGLACELDRRFVARRNLPGTVWIFELFVCTKRPR